MVEIISKVSHGSRMDQVYLPKNRVGLKPGEYVVVKSINLGEKITRKPCFYGLDSLEPLKLKAIDEIFQVIESKADGYDNIIITGSFLDKGFDFEDCDILIITPKKVNSALLKKEIGQRVGVKAHILILNNHTLWQGLVSDPLYQLMLSCCVARKRLIYNVRSQLNYQLLDYNLLKSQLLPKNFDVLSGREKNIKEEFKLDNVAQIKDNQLSKSSFLKKYNQLYRETFQRIMQGMHHAK